MEFQKNLAWGFLGYAVFQSLGYFGTAHPHLRLGCSLLIFSALGLNTCYGLYMYKSQADLQVFSISKIQPFIPSIIIGIMITVAVIVGVSAGWGHGF